MQPDNGDVWSAMGHCYLMQDDLQKAYVAYQQALYFLPNPKVSPRCNFGTPRSAVTSFIFPTSGSQAMVWDRHIVRPLWLARSCGRSFFECPENGSRYVNTSCICCNHHLIRVLLLPLDFEKADEIYFRLGIIYKQQQKYPESLDVTSFRSSPRLCKSLTPIPLSVSIESSEVRRIPLPTWIFGFKLDMYTSSRKTYAQLFFFSPCSL